MKVFMKNRTPGDIFLDWLSFTKSGPISSLESTLGWFATTENIDLNRFDLKRVISLYESHGYIDLDWSDRRWLILPSQYVRIPYSDGVAQAVGERSWSFALKIVEGLDASIHIQSGSSIERLLPSSIFFTYDSVEDLTAKTESLGLFNSELILNDTTEGIFFRSLIRPSAPVPNSAILSRLYFGRDSEVKYQDVDVYAALKSTGVYRFAASTGQQYFWVQDDNWYQVDRRYALHRLAQSQKLSVSSWTKTSTTHSQRIGTVTVSQFNPFPSIVERSLVLSSGLSPKHEGNSYIYQNITLKTWYSIKSLLRSDLIGTENAEF